MLRNMSCRWGQILSKRSCSVTHAQPSHLPRSPTPSSHCITLTVCDLAHRRWTTLPATAACYQSPRQGELKMSWVHACKTDRWPRCHPADLYCFLPLASLGFQVPLPTPASGNLTSVLFLYSTCAVAPKLDWSSLCTARFSSTVTVY